MELSSEQIKKALECCIQFCDHGNMAVCKECPLKECRCSVEMPKNALALIKKLTEANEQYQTENMVLSGEIERLSGKVEQYEEERKYHFEMSGLRIAEGKANALRKFAERIKRYYNTLNGKTNSFLVAYHIDEVLKEMIGEAK